MGARLEMQKAARERAEAMLVEQEERNLTHKELAERHDLSATRIGVILKMARAERLAKS